MRRLRKKWKKPKKPWDKARIEEEAKIIKKYGLKNKREIWKAEAKIDKIRQQAKKLITASSEEQQKFINRLVKLGLVQQDAKLDDVLALTKEKLLDRRLQTIVYKLGLANTPKQARQLIVHGHVFIAGRKVNRPSYHVSIDEEKLISVKPEVLEKIKKQKSQEKVQEESTEQESKQQAETET